MKAHILHFMRLMFVNMFLKRLIIVIIPFIRLQIQIKNKTNTLTALNQNRGATADGFVGSLAF